MKNLNILGTVKRTVFQNDLKKVAERLGDKKAKLTYQRLRPLYFLILVISVLFNGLSAVTAASLEFDFANKILHNATIAVAASIIFFSLLALIQRYLLVLIFEDVSSDGKVDFPGLIFGAVLISGALITMSFFGAGEVVKRTASNPILKIADIAELDQQIATASGTIEDLKKNKNSQGEIFYYSQKGINQQTTLLQNLIEEKNRRIQKAETENASIRENHERSINQISFNFGWITVATELLLPFCIFFICWYRERSFKELSILFFEIESPTMTNPVVGLSKTNLPFSKNEVGFKAIAERERKDESVHTVYTAHTAHTAHKNGDNLNQKELLRLRFKDALNDCQREINNLVKKNGREDRVKNRLKQKYQRLFKILPLVVGELNQQEKDAVEKVHIFMQETKIHT